MRIGALHRYRDYRILIQSRTFHISGHAEDQLGIHLTITAALKEHLVSKYADNKMGARPLKRAIQSVVEDALAEEILQKKVVPGDKVSAGFKDGKVVFTVKN